MKNDADGRRIPARERGIGGIVSLFIMPASRRFRKEFLRQRAVTPEDASLGEILDRILEQGIFLELSSRLQLLSYPLRGAGLRLTVDWSQTHF